LRSLEVERALSDFREHLGGRLCITLPDGIGQAVEVDSIDIELMKRCVQTLSRRRHRTRG
jgi:3-dehydroquinate synthase